MLVRCTHCGREWDYNGKSAFEISCPSCHYKSKVFIPQNLKFATKAKCGICGKDFVKTKRRSLYCGRTCQATAAANLGGKACHAKHDYSGENNPHWKGGISKNHYHYKKIQTERYPERVKCRHILVKAKASGMIVAPPVCEVCGAAAKLQAHHDDYSKPLEVKWLCRPCHRKLHGGTH